MDVAPKTTTRRLSSLIAHAMGRPALLFAPAEGLRSWNVPVMDIEEMPEPPTIRLSPREGHPSSLWPSAELLLVQPDSPYYVLPVHLGIDSVLGESILAWSAAFQSDFMDDSYDFESRPTWRPGSSALDWYDEGMHLLKELRDFFPDVQIRPEFAHRVFSVNERREALGKLPLCLPEESRTGYVSVSAAREV